MAAEQHPSVRDDSSRACLDVAVGHGTCGADLQSQNAAESPIQERMRQWIAQGSIRNALRGSDAPFCPASR